MQTRRSSRRRTRLPPRLGRCISLIPRDCCTGQKRRYSVRFCAYAPYFLREFLWMIEEGQANERDGPPERCSTAGAKFGTRPTFDRAVDLEKPITCDVSPLIRLPRCSLAAPARLPATRPEPARLHGLSRTTPSLPLRLRPRSLPHASQGVRSDVQRRCRDQRWCVSPRQICILRLDGQLFRSVPAQNAQRDTRHSADRNPTAGAREGYLSKGNCRRAASECCSGCEVGRASKRSFGL